MSHGTAVTPPKHLASAKVPSVLVLPMHTTLVIELKTSTISEHGNISPRRLMTGRTAPWPVSESKMMHTKNLRSNAGANQSLKRYQLDALKMEETAFVTVLFSSPK